MKRRLFSAIVGAALITLSTIIVSGSASASVPTTFCNGKAEETVVATTVGAR